MKAICSKCLGLLEMDDDSIAAGIEGRRESTIYASNELAFPGIGMPGLGSECSKCGKCVAIAVTNEIARALDRGAG